MVQKIKQMKNISCFDEFHLKNVVALKEIVRRAQDGLFHKIFTFYDHPGRQVVKKPGINFFLKNR